MTWTPCQPEKKEKIIKTLSELRVSVVILIVPLIMLVDQPSARKSLSSRLKPCQ